MGFYYSFINVMIVLHQFLKFRQILDKFLVSSSLYNLYYILILFFLYSIYNNSQTVSTQSQLQKLQRATPQLPHPSILRMA